MTDPPRAARVTGLAALVLALIAGATAARAEVPLALETFDAAWRIVRDSHFDEAMNGVDWDGVARDLRPRAAAATTAGELRAVLRDMLGRLDQSHFSVLPASGDTPRDSRDLGGTPGFDVRLVGRDLLVTHVEPGGPAAATGVRPGWKVSAVGSEPVADLLDRLGASLEPRVLQVEAWRQVQTRLRGPAGSTAAVLFGDAEDRPVRLLIERHPEEGQPVTVGHLPTLFVRLHAGPVATPGGRKAGVIRFNVWMAAIDPLFQKVVDEYRTHDGIVIDLRGNPGGLAGMLMGISGHFLDERKPLGVMKTRGERELRFFSNPRRVSLAGERVTPYAGPLAILVDALSGSATECFAGGMQAIGRARVFGQRTMGQALPALFSRLPNGDVLIHAFGDFVTADGTRLEGRGVIPDALVPLDRRDLSAGRDRTLDAALAWIDAAAGKRGGLQPGGAGRHPY